jgi:hypothetical protein
MEPQSMPVSAVQDLIDPAQKSATAITVAATAFGLLAVFLVNLISGAVLLRLLDPQSAAAVAQTDALETDA